jgi:hypothetical protein
MNDTIELLKEVDAGCKMAIDSIDRIENFHMGPEMAHVTECYKQKHQALQQKVTTMLRGYGETGKMPNTMAATMAKTTAQVKMFVRQDNHQAAKILMDGCNMGIQSVSEYINKYKGASSESISAAKSLIQTEEDFMCDLKKFL